jgi:hypothetical protein
MQERVDRTEPVEILDDDGHVLARAACRYTVSAGGWHGMLSDIRPSNVLEEGAYRLQFAGRPAVAVTITAFSPRDLRRAYFSGETPPPRQQ